MDVAGNARGRGGGGGGGRSGHYPKRRRGGHPDVAFDIIEMDPMTGSDVEFDWARFSGMLTDVVTFASRQYPYTRMDDRFVVQVLDRRPCPLALRGTVYEKQIQLDWSASDMELSYRACFADCMMRWHEDILKEAFVHYNLVARNGGDSGWTAFLWLPVDGAGPEHRVIHCPFGFLPH